MYDDNLDRLSLRKRFSSSSFFAKESSLESENNVSNLKELETKEEKINNTLITLEKKRLSNEYNDIHSLIGNYKKIKLEIENHIIECNKQGIKNNFGEDINTINYAIEDLEFKSLTSITYSQAENFMRKRCKNLETDFLEGKTILINGIKIHYFLTALNDGITYCILSISEKKPEINSATCGMDKIKIKEWNSLN
jgi:hypothetical protein